MKNFVLTALALIFVGTVSAQKVNSDQQLLKKFTQVELSAMDANTKAFHTFCINNSFMVVDFPAEKEGDAAINGARSIANINSINFFELNIELKEDEYQYFKVLGTDKLLIIKPITLIKSEM